MNIHEAATSGKPFTNPDMIGAWMIVDGRMVHRDCVDDFKDMDWIKANCMERDDELYWMHVSDLQRNDWLVID